MPVLNAYKILTAIATGPFATTIPVPALPVVENQAVAKTRICLELAMIPVILVITLIVVRVSMRSGNGIVPGKTVFPKY